MKLTKEQIESYNNNPNHCPYCGSENIVGHSIEVDWKGAWQAVSCEDCGKDWNDTFVFNGIEENQIGE